jgi:hypothetical protein
LVLFVIASPFKFTPSLPRGGNPVSILFTSFTKYPVGIAALSASWRIARNDSFPSS